MTEIDNRRTGGSVNVVRRLRSFVAAVLLALWMPVTLCCEMERVGVLPECGACDDEKATNGVAKDCDVDSRAMLESGTIRLQHHVPVVKAPDWADFLLTPPAGANRLPPAVSIVRTTAPPEWIHSWQFVMRAAPRSRAPSFMA